MDDIADACLFLMNNYNEAKSINIGGGEEITIKNLAFLIKEIVNYTGDIVFDDSKPDGTPRKILDSSKINFIGWNPTTGFREGIKMSYIDFKERYDNEKT